MFKVEGNKLVGSNYSFELPQGFGLAAYEKSLSGNFLAFDMQTEQSDIIKIYIETKKYVKSKRRNMLLDLSYERYLIKNIKQCWDGRCDFLSDFEKVRRGEKEATFVFYQNKKEKVQSYKETYSFEENSEGEHKIDLSVEVTNYVQPVFRDIRQVVQIPEIKNFLNGIEYF